MNSRTQNSRIWSSLIGCSAPLKMVSNPNKTTEEEQVQHWHRGLFSSVGFSFSLINLLRRTFLTKPTVSELQNMKSSVCAHFISASFPQVWTNYRSGILFKIQHWLSALLSLCISTLNIKLLCDIRTSSQQLLYPSSRLSVLQRSRKFFIVY